MPVSAGRGIKMHNTDQIGSTIARLRTEKGLKQNQLSAMLNISPGNLSNYEHGVYWPALDTLCMIADLFNVSTDFLLGRTGYRCPPEALAAYVTPDYTMHQIVNTLLELDTGSLDSVVKYAEFLKSTKNNTVAKNSGKKPSRKSAPPRRKAAQSDSSRS